MKQLTFWKSQNIDCSFAHLTKPKYHSLHALPTHLEKNIIIQGLLQI